MGREDGVALVVAILAMLLMTAIGTALVLNTSSETAVAQAFRSAAQGLYAADAMAERALEDLRLTPDWRAVLDGSVRSSFVDGPPAGTRTLAGGGLLDLTQAVAGANSGGITPWLLYAYGPLAAILPGRVESPCYVVAMVAADPSPGLLSLRAEAFGPAGAHKIVELTVARKYDPPDGSHGGTLGDVVRILAWREVR